MTQSIDYKTLAAELVRHIRGKRSQTFINKKLGIQFTNKMNKWENKADRVAWSDFVKLASIAPSNRLKDAIEISTRHTGSPLAISNIIKTMIGGLQITKVANRTGISRFRLHRWISGERSPSLDEFLHLCDCLSRTLDEFLQTMMGAAWSKHKNSKVELKSEASKDPDLGSLAHGLAIWKSQGKNSDQVEFLARLTGLKVAKVKSLLKIAVKKEMVLLVNNHYVANDLAFQFRNRDDTNAFGTYWAKHLAKRFEDGIYIEGDHIATLQFAVSEETDNIIAEKTYQYYREVLELCEADKAPKISLRVLLLAYLKTSKLSF